MKTAIGMAGFAAVLAASIAAGALSACGGDDSSGTGTAASDGGPSTHADGATASAATDSSTAADVSFTGPSCQNGSVLGQSPTCTACVESQCADVTSCETANCAAYIGCYCACAAGDASCTSACASMQNASCLGCFEQAFTCVSGVCMAECEGNVPTADASLDAAPEAGPYTGSCATLQQCCASITNTTAAKACNGVLTGSQNSQTQCQAALGGFEDAGACP